MNEVATRPAPPSTFPAMLLAYKGEIARALPRHLSADRMTRIALTAFRRTPKLGQCDPRSVFAAVIQAAQLGLEPDTLGRSYLVPYEKRKKVDGQWKTVAVECQLIPGWKGLVDLVNRAGNASVWTGAVFEGDEFDYQLGDSPFVTHRPGVQDDPKLLRYVYAVGRVKGSDWPVIEVWPIAKVWKHRDRYNKVGDRHYSFENEEMYARKVPLLQVLKYMPASIELTQALALDAAAESGGQSLTVQDAIEGTFSMPSDDEEQRPPAGAETAAGPQDNVKKPLPPLDDETFAKKLADWKLGVADGLRIDRVLAMNSARYALTPAQIDAIKALEKKPAAAEGAA
jgi:recombination protein RecT